MQSPDLASFLESNLADTDQFFVPGNHILDMGNLSSEQVPVPKASNMKAIARAFEQDDLSPSSKNPNDVTDSDFESSEGEEESGEASNHSAEERDAVNIDDSSSEYEDESDSDSDFEDEDEDSRNQLLQYFAKAKHDVQQSADGKRFPITQIVEGTTERCNWVRKVYQKMTGKGTRALPEIDDMISYLLDNSKVALGHLETLIEAAKSGSGAAAAAPSPKKSTQRRRPGRPKAGSRKRQAEEEVVASGRVEKKPRTEPPVSDVVDASSPSIPVRPEVRQDIPEPASAEVAPEVQAEKMGYVEERVKEFIEHFCKPKGLTDYAKLALFFDAKDLSPTPKEDGGKWVCGPADKPMYFASREEQRAYDRLDDLIAQKKHSQVTGTEDFVDNVLPSLIIKHFLEGTFEFPEIKPVSKTFSRFA